jgi:IS30 family transposase
VVVAGRMSVAEKLEIWRLLRAGTSFRVIGRQLGRSDSSIQQYVGLTGGVRPRERCRAANQLSLGEREEISRGMAAGESVRAVARRLGRAPSTVSRELIRNGGRRRYRAAVADHAAWGRTLRPKRCKLATNTRLREVVAVKLGEDWSPQQIAGWLVRTFPDEPEMWVSHETIYLTLFVQARGALKRELATHLRTRRMKRRSRAHTSRGHGRGQIVDAVAISERPAEVEDRAVPGHWEGDLLIGSGRSQIATLVERSTRFVMLVRLPEGRSTEDVVSALASHVQTLPVQLRRSLTWDRGLELADHKRFTVDTGVQVYFCDPKSPWQRGSNENTNGLLRQYFPKGTSIAAFTQAQLDEIAAKLNGRPRQTLNWMTPSEKLHEVLH